MQGGPTWRENARELRVRYLFWGPLEKSNYRTSKHPWENTSRRIADGKWGAIYDLENAASSSAAR
jgi:hypothetical protein